MGKVVFCTKVDLFKTNAGRELKEANLQHFDKTLLEYKKHFIFLAKRGIVFVGYSPISKSKETPKVYQKEYTMENVGSINLIYKTSDVNYTAYKTETTYRTVRTQYGSSYQEEVNEQRPYQATKSVDTLQYGYVNFKNIINDTGYFDFVNKKKSIELCNKMIKACNKINIPCDTNPEQEG